MVNEIKIVCDRCKQEIDGERGEDFTSGFYEVGPSPNNMWRKFVNEGEAIVCDNCMWHDQRYIDVYGKVYSDK